MLWNLVIALSLWLPSQEEWIAGSTEPGAPAEWIPEDAPLAFEVWQPKALLDLLLDARVARAVTSSPAWQQQASQPEFQVFQNVVKFVETRLETDWRSGLRRALGGGVALAVDSKGGALWIADAVDSEVLEQLHDIFRGFAMGGEQSAEVSREEFQGVDVWTFDGESVHAIAGSRFLLSNRRETLKTALALGAGSGEQNLSALPAYRAARKAAGSGASGGAFVNLQSLRQHPALQQALAQGPHPLASLLVPGVMAALGSSAWAALGLEVKGDTLALQAVAAGTQSQPLEPPPFAHPAEPTAGVLPNLAVPGQIAGLSFYRDLETFYALKDQLFPERTSGLIFFENMMGIFFSGRDLTGEVLAETGPEVRFVVAAQEYDPAVGTPRVQWPAFAAILPLRHPDAFTLVVEEAWQKAVGLINFTRGQQALPGLIIDRPDHRGTRFTVAAFSAAGAKDRTGLDSRYNFRPALARTGDHLILSSTDGLARDLIDALKKEAARPVQAAHAIHSLAQVNAARLGSLLVANRENMVQQNMVEEGNTREQAEVAIDVLTAVIGYLGGVQLEFGLNEGKAEARLELKLNLPQRQAF